MKRASIFKLSHAIIVLVSLAFLIPQAYSAGTSKERLVLMPLRVSEADKGLQGAMETALVEGLQQGYEVFSGEQVAQKAREIFLKESRTTTKKDCDETRCMQGIAEAFQAELIATTSVTKRSDGYFLALSIRNIFDNKVEYSKSLPCEGCNAYQVVSRLKELGGGSVAITTKQIPEKSQPKLDTNDPDGALWAEAKKGNSVEDYQVYLGAYPKGKYVPFAKANIKKINEAEKAAAELQEQQAWNTAQEDASEESYNLYLKNYPAGRFSGLAKVRAQKLKNDIAAKEEADFWKTAKTSEDVKLIQSFIDKYPSSSHRTEAQQKITSLKKSLANRKIVDEILEQAKKGEDSRIGQIEELARQGNADAQGNLARMYFNGWGVKQDYQQALAWARKADKNGNSDGTNIIGVSFFNGFGTEKNEAEGLKWYRKAAEKGNDLAQLNLGGAYAKGKGVTRNDVEALNWFQKAAASGNSTAMLNIGYCYSKGLGVDKSDVRAVSWYRKAADAGNVKAMANLGNHYSKGEGVMKSEEQAIEWYRKAADAGYDKAMNSLGVRYSEGRGVQKNDGQAVAWYRKAADAGNAMAMSNLGKHYANGLGVEKSDELAVEWYRKAADAGNKNAIRELKKRGLQ